jgi:hypothetical protein
MRRKMKKIVFVLVLAASVLMPTSAQAAETKFTGAPLTNLDSQGAAVTIMLLGVPTKGGLYIQECVEAPAGTRPLVCNAAVQLWISTARGASFAPTDVIKFKPTGSFVSGTTTVDCTVSKCGIFMRYDHTVPGDLSEDQFIALTFKPAAAATVALPVDEVTATINGTAVSTKAPITLGYRQLSKVAATSKAGATLTYASIDPNCALKGQEITPLKGAGECAISITSAGNATATGVTAILPIRLTLGVQAIPAISAKKSVTLPATTNFGQKISYKSTGNCSIKKNLLTTKKGKCTIDAHAEGQAGLFEMLHKTIVLNTK